VAEGFQRKAPNSLQSKPLNGYNLKSVSFEHSVLEFVWDFDIRI
jgi:hypothetical protein